MTKRIFSLLIIVLSLVTMALATTPEYVEGRLIVKFNDGAYKTISKSVKGPVDNLVVLEEVSNMAIPNTSVIRGYDSDQRLGVFGLPVGMTVEQAISLYFGSGLVEYAEPDYIFMGSAYTALPDDQPNDPQYYEKWDHDLMQVHDAWGYGTGSSDVVVAVIDTGVAYLHEDLFENICIASEFIDGSPIVDENGDPLTVIVAIDTAGEKWQEDDPDFDPMDIDGHGTHVSGIIGAKGNNGVGVAGVNWNVSLMGVKVFADDTVADGGTAFAITSDIIAGIDWSITNDFKHADVINMSLGGGSYSQAFKDAIERAGNAGVIVVVAAGNDLNNNDRFPAYPASYDLDNIVSVMATDEDDHVAWYSNYGETTVDIAAPGGGHNPGVYSTLYTPGESADTGTYSYGHMSGTSMAAPQVAGALALMKAVINDPNSTLWPDTAVKFMYLASDKLPVLSGLCATERRLNVFRAIEALNSSITNVEQSETYDFDELARAVSEANAGETLEFTAGIFPASVIVDKSLNFKGTDPNSPSTILFDEDYATEPYGPIFSLMGSGNTFTFENMKIQDGVAGAILADIETTVTVTDCLFENNATTNGGAAIFAALDSVVTVVDVNFNFNVATMLGGGIYLDGATLDIDTAIFTQNAAGLSGGAIYADNEALIDANDCTMYLNTAAGDNGGAIGIDNDTLLIMIDSSCGNNSAEGSGGAIFANESLVSLTDVTFDDNFTVISFPPYGGGAIYCGGVNGSISLERADFTRNDAASDGGALFVEEATAQIIDSNFSSNECLGNGGAIYFRNTLNAEISNATIRNNSSSLFGGGVSIYSSDVEMYNLLLTDNSSYWQGGAVYIEGALMANSNVILVNSTIDNNTASISGSGVYLTDNNTVDLINNIFTNNLKYAVYEYGAYSNLRSNNCLYFDNLDGDVFSGGVLGLAGAVAINSIPSSANNLDDDPMYMDGNLGSYYLSHVDAGQIFDADMNIASESGTSATSPCYEAGFGLADDYNLGDKSTRTDGAFDAGIADIGYHYADPGMSGAPVVESESVLIIPLPSDGGMVSPDVMTMFKPHSHVVLQAVADVGYSFYRWTTPSGRVLTEITDDNPNGDYYGLYDADGQLMYVDNGVEGVPSRIVVQLDFSKSFNALFEEAVARLRIYVDIDINGNPPTYNGTISQNGTLNAIEEYLRGEVVELEAIPSNPEHQVRWHGTDEDSKLSRTNTVTLTQNFQDVYVEFYQPKVWTVGPQGDAMFDSLRKAIDNQSMNDGDIIQLLPGEHSFNENNNPDDPSQFVTINRPVIIQGGDPGNPESTVIKDGLFEFVGVGRDTIVRDITFDQTNHTYHSGDGWDGCTSPNNIYSDGDHGASWGGCMMRLVSTYNVATSSWTVASPTIQNCRLVGGTFDVGSGGNGCIVDPYHGDGGWPGISYGGAVWIGNHCKPIFENCEFIDLHVQGGHGGNAALTSKSAHPGLWGNPANTCWAYLGHFFTTLPGYGTDDESGTFSAFRFVLPHEKKTYYPAVEEKNQYAGRGGAIYIGIGAEPIIRNCRFEDCSAMSGSSGIGHFDGVPRQHYRIPSYGGAVFCDAMSKPLFEDCEFKNNIAHWEQPTAHPDGGTISSTNDYQSNGGAVYAQRNSRPKFMDCYFEGNQAVMGGAICVDNVGYIETTDNSIESLIIEDCEFVENTSDIGGAVAIAGGINSDINFLSVVAYPTDSILGMTLVEQHYDYSPGMDEPVSLAAGYSMLVRSDFTGNEAIIQLEDMPILVDENGDPITDEDGNLINPVSQDAFSKSGHGGAIAAYSSKTEINDCKFRENSTGGFGGAVYVSGKSIYDVEPLIDYSNMYLRNCLLANNYAGLGGGGINITTRSDPQLSNCTIADNAVTSAGGKGGGVLVNDLSTVSIQNSILYGNLCSNGSQVALCEPYEDEPSNADIRFSLIEPLKEEPPFIDTGLDAVRGINTDDFSRIFVDEINDYFQLDPLANTSTSLIELGFTVNFYGLTTNRIYVSDNGCISFWKPIVDFSEFLLNTNVETPVIAAFHADVDSSRGNTVSYGRGSVEIEENGVIVTCRVFFVNYIDIGYYNEKQDKLNSFQLVLIERTDRGENDFDIELNYDKIQWEAGDDEGGTDGLGGTTARVGFTKGTGIPGTFYELEGSGVDGSFLDNATTALIARNRNSSAIGRLRFPVEEGEPQISYGSPIYTEGMSTINYNADMDMWDPASKNITVDPLWAVEGLYYLSSVETGQDASSECIDAGAGEARDYNIYRHTTRVDSVLDINTVDMGYHYTLPVTEGLYGDFDFNGEIDADEWLWAIDYWLDSCDYPYWCHGTDMNEDGIVNLVDRTVMAPIGATDTVSPQPILGEDGLPVETDFSTDEVKRMTWETKPVSAGSGIPAITMTASTTIDNCIGTIEYSFVCTYGAGHSSGWITDREYTDTGLTIDVEYAYVCYARDSHGNETLASLAVRTRAGDDSQAPITDADSTEPTKAKWESTPQTAAITDGFASIRMEAVTAVDPEGNGVEYFFECTSGNGYNSTWQESPEYVDTGLVIDELYTYRVKTRDTSRNLNEGLWSEEASAMASEASVVDGDNPYPLACILRAEQVYEPSQFFSGKEDAWHEIEALTESQDASDPVWYQFVCLSKSSYTSPRIYTGGIVNETLDPAYFEIVTGTDDGSNTTITWRANVGPYPGKTLDWKVICGDSAESENAYTVSEQPQKVRVGYNRAEMNYEDVIHWVLVIDGVTYYPPDYDPLSGNTAGGGSGDDDDTTGDGDTPAE